MNCIKIWARILLVCIEPLLIEPLARMVYFELTIELVHLTQTDNVTCFSDRKTV